MYKSGIRRKRAFQPCDDMKILKKGRKSMIYR